MNFDEISLNFKTMVTVRCSNKTTVIFLPGKASQDYSSVNSETGFILKEDEDNLDVLLLRGGAYYYLAGHDVANR